MRVAEPTPSEIWKALPRVEKERGKKKRKKEEEEKERKEKEEKEKQNLHTGVRKKLYAVSRELY